MTDNERALDTVNRMLSDQYGITSDDCEEEIILGGLKTNMLHQEIVDHIAEKYDLEKINMDMTLKPQYTDGTPMPFGKHKGIPLSDVPASYFHWLWSKQGMKDDKVSPVADYIRRNITALEKEYPDGIW